MKSRSLFALAAASVAVIALSACTALGNLTTPAASPLVQVAVDVAVAQVVGNPGPAAHAKAQQISSIAQEALALDTGSSVAITAIEAAVTAKVASLHLQPADQLAAQVLMQTVTAIIQQKLGGGSTTTAAGTVTAATNVAIATVLNDVIQACAVY